jgi:hypothetical protein
MTVYQVAGRVSYGSIRGVSQMSYTRSRGIQPGVIQLSVPELPAIPVGFTGPVYFTDGNREFSMGDCLLQSVDIDWSNGIQYVLSIADSRWRWKYGQISGNYNTVRAGAIVQRSRKLPRELAELCLQAMGVRYYDVSAMPDDVYPEVTWDLDVPSVALEDLCSNLGCVVCPMLNGAVVISRQGVGKKLPFILGCEIKESIKIVTTPDAIAICADPTLWEVSLKIGEPVGLEVDGRVLPINKLSYAPKNDKGVAGWTHEDPKSFANVATKYRKLAQQSVWKWFRFSLPIHLPNLDPPDGDRDDQGKSRGIVSADQIYFTPSCLTKVVTLGEDMSVERRKEPFAYGRYYDRKDRGSNNVQVFSHKYDENTALLYEGSWAIDEDQAIVKFSDAVFLYDDRTEATARFLAPDLRIRTAIGYKNKHSDAKLREVLTVPTGYRNGTKPLWTRRPDLRREIIVDPETNAPAKVNGDNVNQIEKQLKAYAGFEMAKFRNEIPRQGEYAGFAVIELDGTIEQVTYAIDESGLTSTTASYGAEHSLIIASFEERSRVAKLNAVLKQQSQIMNSKRDTGAKR